MALHSHCGVQPPDIEYYLQHITMHDKNVTLAFVQLSDLLHTVRTACGMNRLRLRPEARTCNLQQCGNNFEVRVFGVIEIITRQLGRHDSSQDPFDGTRKLPLTLRYSHHQIRSDQIQIAAHVARDRTPPIPHHPYEIEPGVDSTPTCLPSQLTRRRSSRWG